MKDYDPQPERRSTDNQLNQNYANNSNLEAHIIADMLRIESITAELKEFKDDTKQKLNKLEGWIVALVGITITTLLGTLTSIAIKVLGG